MALEKLPLDIKAGERGFTMIMVLVLLLIGSLIAAPLLSYMSVGILNAAVHEKQTVEYYAAEAGIEKAFWGLISENVTVPDCGTVELPDITVNDKIVDVNIEDLGDLVYEITSVAQSASGSNTTLVVHISILDFMGLMGNAITSLNDVTFQPGSSTNGTVVEDYSGDWPTAEELIEYYRNRVDTSSPYGSGQLDIATIPLILPTGTLYREGDLDIINSGSSGALGTLNGNMYVTGNLNIGLTNQDFTLDLNGKTIFAEGEINIGGKCTLTGVGCIIAIGDIYFSPKLNSDPNNFIFVMSINGTIFMSPNGDFYGSLAGNAEVQLQPGCTSYWVDPSGDDFEFPDGSWDDLEILDWIIVGP